MADVRLIMFTRTLEEKIMTTEFKMFDTDELIMNVLPNLLKNKTNVRVIFSTYNDVTGYDTGFVKTKKEGLEIFVINGCRSNNMKVFALQMSLMDSDFTNPINLRLFERTKEYDEKDTGQSIDCVRDSSLNAFDTDSELLYFTYVGLNAMEKSLSFAREIKNTYPNATVIAVACDCNLSEKKRSLSEANKNGEIDFAVKCKHCGGGYDMSLLLDSFIE